MKKCGHSPIRFRQWTSRQQDTKWLCFLHHKKKLMKEDIIRLIVSYSVVFSIRSCHEINYVDCEGYFLGGKEENAAVPRYGEAF